jgi:predicted O-linked N-acetylglucosamine transferase (SPINDLY family)
MLHLHPDFDEAIRLILMRDPLAHVFLLCSSNRRSWKHQLQSRIEAHIGPKLTGRVLFFTDVDTRQEILLLGAADAVLASLHATRAKAAMQAFTAGVPVVTLVGTLWATRVTSAFYRLMGVRGLTVTTLDEYAALAVRLATDNKFRDRMTRKIRRNRERLSRDRVAVSEWEKFFDFAGARLQEGGADDKVQRTELVHSERVKEAVIVDMAMTCPATSLLDLL